jgi:hypothetical protein
MLNGEDRIKERVASRRGARQSHAELVSQREGASRELSALMQDQERARSQLAVCEREIAVAGGAVPDGPLPEETEVGRLGRRIRIAQARVADWDERIGKSQATIETLNRDLEEAWEELGASLSDSLYRRFCDAVAMVREAWLEYCALVRHFRDLRYERKIHWRFLGNLAISGRRGALLIDPFDSKRPEKWPPGASSLLAELGALRAEIKAAREK